MQVDHLDSHAEYEIVITDISEGSIEPLFFARYKGLTRDWLNQILAKSIKQLAQLGQEDVLADAHAQFIAAKIIKFLDKWCEAMYFSLNKSMLKIWAAESLSEAIKDRLHKLLQPDDKWVLILHCENKDQSTDAVENGISLLAELSDLARHRIGCEKALQVFLDGALQILYTKWLNEVRRSLDTLNIRKDCALSKELNWELSYECKEGTPVEFLPGLTHSLLWDDIVGDTPRNILVAEIFRTKVVIHNWSISHTIQHLLESRVVKYFDIIIGLKVSLENFEKDKVDLAVRSIAYKTF